MNIYAMLPFLSKKDIDKYLDKVISGEIKNVKLAAFLPFASRDKIDAIFKSEYKKGNLRGESLHKFFPFISKEILHELVVDYCQNGGTPIPTSIVPFLAQEDISMLFEYKLSHPEEDASKDDKENNGFEFNFDFGGVTDMATNISKAVNDVVQEHFNEGGKGEDLGDTIASAIGNMFGSGKKVNVHYSTDNDDDEEDDEEEREEDIEDAIEDVEGAMEDLDDAMDDLDEAIGDAPISSKKLEKLKEMQRKINEKLAKYNKEEE